MPHQTSAYTFERLTAKQNEALSLASEGFTSKEIARKLDISPHSVDKRIDMVRSAFNGASRVQIIREYREWLGCQSTTGGPPTLAPPPTIRSEPASQSEGQTLVFRDSLAFDEYVKPNLGTEWLRPGIKPIDVGPGKKLLLVIGGAFILAAAFLLVVAAAEALVGLLAS